MSCVTSATSRVARVGDDELSAVLSRRIESRTRVHAMDADPVPAEVVDLDLNAQCAAVADASIALISVPALALSRVYAGLARHVQQPITVIQVESSVDGAGNCAADIAREALSSRLRSFALLTGGLSVDAIGRGQPCAAVLACEDAAELEQLGTMIVDDDLHLHRTRDLSGAQWAAALANVYAFARGLTLGAEFAPATRAWLLNALEDEIVALATRELDLEESFVRHGGAWQRELRARAFLPSRSERFGSLLARGFTNSDACESSSASAEEVDCTTVLRGLTTRGLSRDCPGIEALANLAIGASSVRELWVSLLGERCER